MSTDNTKTNKIVAESIEIFEDVNQKISGLIDCSVKDFDLLNSNFKNYYSNLQVISGASNDFLAFLSSISSTSIFQGLKNQVETTSLSIYDKVNNYLIELKNSNKKINYLILSLNNLTQDLSTIKLLFTNLKFDPLFNIDLTAIQSTSNTLSKCLSSLHSKVNKHQQGTTKKINYLEEKIINNLELLIDQTKEIENVYKHISDSTSNALKYSQTLNELEKKRLSSTSEIITKLQFQDILRQKIEHVQEAYEEITLDLKKAKEEESELKPEEQFKIRDIATLQSAQLIHSSQEYQSAVETILNRISELNTFLNNYQLVWNHFCKPGINKLLTAKSKLVLLLEKLGLQSNTLDVSSQKLFNSLKNKEKDTFFNSDEDTCKEYEKLKELFTSIDAHYENDKQNSAYLQIKYEFDKFDKSFRKLHAQLKKFELPSELSELISEKEIKDDFVKILKYIHSNTEFFNKDLSQKIEELNNEAVNIEVSNGFDVEQVTYYKTFEKEIHEIIGLLDNLLTKISVKKADIDKDRLEHLKKIYTMESERKVHDIISGNISESENKTDEENNEIEFF